MKKYIETAIVALMLILPMVSAGPTASVTITPTYTEQAFSPLVFLNMDGGRVLMDDPYGFYANGNIAARPQNYAFTGEQIQWKVLVWDKNGMPEKIKDVWAGWVAQTNGPLDPDVQVNCQIIATQQTEGYSLALMGYSNVRRPNEQEPQSTFNPSTMREYLCTLTVEPTCIGQQWFGVKAEDLAGLTGTMQEAESWFCNPELDLIVSGNINFGTLGPGEQAATTFSVKNAAEEGSGTMVVMAISGSDFYDSTSSGAKCPTSNVLKLQGNGDTFTTGFWYSATRGSLSVSKKRIPYGDDISESDPIFSASTSATQWRKWSGTLMGQAASPGSETSITLHLGLPQPCNGQFTDGDITLWAWAV